MPTQILQLTDLHLIADPERRLKGVPTRESLAQVIRFIQSECARDRWCFDYVVVTGDVAHEEPTSTYELLREEMLAEWMPRCGLVPGNHDNRDSIRQVFSELVIEDSSYACFSVEVGRWRLIGLDSHVPGEVAGELAEDQLDWLSAELRRNASQPTLLFLHHPAFPVNSAWLDGIGLRDPSRFLSLVSVNPQVRAISAGHVHFEFADRFGEVELLTTPSTCIQFRGDLDTQACDPVPPGFRIFELAGDRYSTEVVRLPELLFPPE